MSPEEYNGMLFSLILRNAEFPYKEVAATDIASGAKSIGIWCKALIDTYNCWRRIPDDSTPPQSPLHISCATEGCLNICLTVDGKEAIAMGWQCIEVEPERYYCHDCAGQRIRNQQAIAQSVGPGPCVNGVPVPGSLLDEVVVRLRRLENREKSDEVFYSHVADVFEVELKAFLTRARDASRANNDRSLFDYLLTCVEPPPSPENVEIDF